MSIDDNVVAEDRIGGKLPCSVFILATANYTRVDQLIS